MSDQLQLRGGTTAVNSGFTGASRELSVDTTKDTVIVHDGSTPGGHPLLKEDQTNLPISVTNGLYAPGTNQVALATAGTGRLFVNANGNIGIGTTSPSSLLTLRQTAASHQIIEISRPNSDIGALYLGNDTNNNAVIAANNSDIRFGTDVSGTFTERARIDSSGRLLVGTSSTATSGDSASAKIQIQANTSATSGDALISLQRGQAAASIPSDSPLGKILFADNAGNEYGVIQCRTDGSSGSGDYPGRLVFSTTADGASSL